MSEGAGLIDFVLLKSQGIKAVVIRIGHGMIQDADAADYIRSATNAGLVVHVYHQLEEADGEIAWSLANVEKLLVKTGSYYFLDVSKLRIDNLQDIFRSFSRNWLQAGYKVGIHCTDNQLVSLSNVNFKSTGIYRWTTLQSAADLWQITSEDQDKLSKNVDQTGLLIKAVEQDSHITDPDKDYQVKAGAFVGFDYSTTKISGGKMLVSSPDGVNKIPKLGPDGNFIFNKVDADRLWTSLKPKIEDLDWARVTNKLELVTETELNSRLSQLSSSGTVTSLDWTQITNKPDLATKQDLRNISLTPGPAGHDGKSAYEIAVDNGFTGSQADWLQSLHGRDGTSSTSGDNSLSTQAIAELIKQHLRVQIDSATGNLVVNIDEHSNGSIADAVAVKVAQSCHFSLDNGNLVMTLGGA